jgi:Calcineurin-like phosphoesterase
MHEAAGSKPFIAQSLLEVSEQISSPSATFSDAINHGCGETDAELIERRRSLLSDRLREASSNLSGESAHADIHYVSRFSAVGIFQSALSAVFADIPELQGYGDANPIWIVTVIEEFAYKVKSFFARVHEDRSGKKQSLWAALVSELVRIGVSDDRAPYPGSVPKVQSFPDDATVALLADWGGDNDAAKQIAAVVSRQNPEIAVHLGDIYYGGTNLECEIFLGLWPLRENPNDPKSPVLKVRSLALNGNHEMYSGGKYYFSTVLPAFGQSQPFFCLENQHWRILGLDTAYAGGRLRPQSPQDPITAQWNWLIERIRTSKKANIFLTHHQPVSAHRQEWLDSADLRSDITELLSQDGIGQDAIFGWFFGHEHRCALYKDTALPYNARLIGNGCIPHEVQRERACDPGCTEVDFFNKKETKPGSNVAVSSFAKLSFSGAELLIEYVDETCETWGAERWDASKGRLSGTKFIEFDGRQQ